jgi:hypothetical protein
MMRTSSLFRREHPMKNVSKALGTIAVVGAIHFFFFALPSTSDAATIGYWRFEEGTVDSPASGSGAIVDSSPSGDDGTSLGGPVYRSDVPVSPIPKTGALNKLSLEFDGVDDAVLLNSIFIFHQPGDATLEFWLKFIPTAHQSVFWTRTDDTDANRFNIVVNGNGTFGFDYRSPAGDLHLLVGECFEEGCTGVPIPPDTWTHLAITRVGNVYSLYKNGVLAASATDSAPDLPDATGWQLSGRSGFIYQGSLDEVRVSDVALSPDQFLLARPSPLDVSVDIKPGSSPNTINPKSHGVIPVAILSTDTFDATSVDPLSVEFGPSGATEMHGKGYIKDVNHDGKPDLVLHFKTQATGIQCGDTSASLTGETVDGDSMQGSDSIKTVGCKK